MSHAKELEKFIDTAIKDALKARDEGWKVRKQGYFLQIEDEDWPSRVRYGLVHISSSWTFFTKIQTNFTYRIEVLEKLQNDVRSQLGEAKYSSSTHSYSAQLGYALGEDPVYEHVETQAEAETFVRKSLDWLTPDFLGTLKHLWSPDTLNTWLRERDPATTWISIGPSGYRRCLSIAACLGWSEREIESLLKRLQTYANEKEWKGCAKDLDAFYAAMCTIRS